MNNKALGNQFETDLCNRLFAHGFWVHKLAQNQAGQPADILAVRNGLASLIDCKVCSGNKFPFTRVEDNQDLSMQLWQACGNGQGWFALLIHETIWMIPYSTIVRLRRQMSYMSTDDIRVHGTSFGTWAEL